MKPLKIADILNVTDGTLLCGDADTEITQICTDSRKIDKGSLFVPLIGENFDGHNFLDAAIDGGAKAVFTSRGSIPPQAKNDTVVIAVEDTLKALGKTAGLYRSLFNIPSVAITGSVGKTTTKEMCAFVLSQKYKVHKNEGNFNNEIGVPLTLFKLTDEAEILLGEMGMSGFGEIDRISAMIKPDTVIMTNIGISHIELLGSQENIYKAKTEFLNHFSPSGTVIINADDAILNSHKNDINAKVISVGIKNESADILAKNIKSDKNGISFKAEGMGKSFDVSVPALGEHNVYNALSAIALGLAHGISEEDIKRAFLSYVPDSMRMCVIKKEDFTIINDCYNAAPDSMAAALKVLGVTDTRRVAVLGDMACLGEHSYSAHRDMGREVSQNADVLITIGSQARVIGESAFENGMDSENIYSFHSTDDAKAQILSVIKKGDTILVKASRVMQLEKITEFLTK